MATVEQLLASLGVDAATASVSSTGRYVLIQRDPQPDEEGIPIDSNVKMMLVDLDGDPTDGSYSEPDFYLSIDGAPAMEYVGGVPSFLGDWNGTVSTWTAEDPYIYWEVDAAQVGGPLFTSEQVVPVELNVGPWLGGWGHGPWAHFSWGHAPAGSWTASFLYEFTCVDLTAPRLSSAEAEGRQTIVATFNEGMALTGSASPLEAGNWEVERTNMDPEPLVELEIESVAQGDSGAEFVLTTQWEHTPGGHYLLRAVGVEDDSGNSIDTDHDEAEFEGFIPDAVEGRSWQIWDFGIPDRNKDQDINGTRDLLRFVNCLQEILDLLLYDVDHFTDQWDPDSADNSQIDAMLFDLGNPFDWADLDLTSNQKRRLLRLLVPIYREKGTAQGIEDVVRLLLGIEVEVVPHNAVGWILGEDELGEGEAASLSSGTAETWDFSGGKTLQVQIDFEPDVTIVFEDADFVVPTAATAAEVAAVIDAAIGAAGLDIGTSSAAGGVVSIDSSTVSHDSRVEVRGGSANDLLLFPPEPSHGIGGAELAPSSSWTRYAFDIEAESVLNSTEKRVIRRIGEYMKVAHEHLVDVSGPYTPPAPDHWELGASELGEETSLHE